MSAMHEPSPTLTAKLAVQDALARLEKKYAEQQTALGNAMAGWTDAANLQLSVVQELKTAKAKCEDLQAERDRMWQSQNDSDLLQAQISCASMLDRLDASTLRLSEQLSSTLEQAVESRAHGLGLLGRNAKQIERLEGHLMQCTAEREVDAARQRRLEKEVIELKTNAGMLIADKALLEREVQRLNEQLSAVAPTKERQASVHSASVALALVEADQMCEDVKQIAEEMQGAHAHACAKALAALSCHKTRCLAQMQVQASNAKALEDQASTTSCVLLLCVHVVTVAGEAGEDGGGNVCRATCQP